VATQSILDSVKAALDLEEDNVDFDVPIIMHINSAFATLWQIGLGPSAGYEIEDSDATWDAFYGTSKRYNAIRTYVCLFVKNLFDPPQTAHHARAMEENLRQHEWRLNVTREETAWTDPNPVHIRQTVLDGGDA